jgi:hypothetical protein
VAALASAVTVIILFCAFGGDKQAATPPESATLAAATASPTQTPTPTPTQTPAPAPTPGAEVTPTASEEIPLAPELQAYMLGECERYGCPYALALAVAEVESHFNMEAVGAVGEVGIMQINPGPGDTYHDELEAKTGLDPDTPEGNITAGVYLLGKYLHQYGSPVKAAMAYNMGASGAAKAWEAGITTSTHAELVVEAMSRWEDVLGV